MPILQAAAVAPPSLSQPVLLRVCFKCIRAGGDGRETAHETEVLAEIRGKNAVDDDLSNQLQHKNGNNSVKIVNTRHTTVGKRLLGNGTMGEIRTCHERPKEGSEANE